MPKREVSRDLFARSLSLADMGEITSDEHEELLSIEEATRIYGTE